MTMQERSTAPLDLALTAGEYFELSRQAKEAADRCQVHKPHHASLLGYAQLFAMWALYEQQCEQSSETVDVRRG